MRYRSGIRGTILKNERFRFSDSPFVVKNFASTAGGPLGPPVLLAEAGDDLYRKIPVKKSRICRIHIAVSNLMKQDYIQMVVQILLVESDGCRQLRECNIARTGQPVSFQHLPDGIPAPGGSQPFFFGKPGDLVHADGNGLAVALPAIVKILLDRMGKGVSKIQQHPFSGIKLVLFHDHPLDIHTATDHRRKLALQAFKGAVLFQSLEQGGI